MAVRKACSTHDPIAARLAILAWGQKQFHDAALNTLDTIAARVGGELGQELRAIDTLLFSKSNSEAWQGARLFKLLKAYDDTTDSNRQAELGLYPTK